MRLVLIITPIERRGYSSSAVLDAIGLGEQTANIRSGEDYIAQVQRWMSLVDAVVVYDDLPLTDDMRWAITIALSARVPVEYRRLPTSHISVIDRVLIEA